MVELNMVVSVNASSEEEAKRFVNRELNADRDNKLNDYLYGYEIKKVMEENDYQYGGGYAKDQPKRRKMFFKKKKTFFPY